jgi:hypothetical protein
MGKRLALQIHHILFKLSKMRTHTSYSDRQRIKDTNLPIILVETPEPSDVHDM